MFKSQSSRSDKGQHFIDHRWDEGKVPVAEEKKRGFIESGARQLRVQRNVQSFGELIWIERAHGEIAALNFEGRNFAAAAVHAQHEFFRFGMLVNIYLAKSYSAFLQKKLRAMTVGAPRCGVHCNLGHYVTSCDSYI